MTPIEPDMLCCPCCHKGIVDPHLVLALTRFQDLTKLPITITSGYRCQEHNASVGGAPLSQHLTGRAADIACLPLSPLALYLVAEQIPAFANGGIGLYHAHYIHVDTRKVRARWFRRAGVDQPIVAFLTAHEHMPSVLF
jgi:uncharacterized protein YcbK (DUF882 family)